MKKRSLVSLLSAFFIIALASCSSGEEGKYEIREIDLYRKSNTVDKKIGIRFYNDNPNVPYIGVKEYFKEFYNTELQLEKENYNFSFKKADEAYLKIDTKNEVLEIKGIYDFSSHPDFHSNNEKIFLHLDNKTSTTKQSKAIDLKNYSINTYASHNDAYVPIALLGNLYGGILGYNVSYNGKELYVLDDTGELSNGESRFDEYYCDTYFSVLSSKEKRHEDLAKYNYNQLCFTFDNLRGYTTQLVFGDHNLQTVGLNALLETYYPDIKRMLLSTERSDYDKGIMLLFGGLYDGGHTGLLTKNPPNTSYYAELREDSRFKDLVNKFMAKDTNKNNKRQAFVEAKAISFGVDYSANPFGYYYDSTNKIAFIAFDKFTVDYQKWDAYYKGDTAKLKELEAEDTYAFVRKSLYDAKAKGAESVVFDFTTNGGGDVAAVMGVFGLINGAKATETKNNIVDKTRMNSNYTIDINLDGKYDEQDVNEAKSFNFNIFGLTSSIAFSSGNYLPSLMKAKGFKMIGEKTGGGSCALSKEATADGYLYLRSTYYSLCDDLGNNIDEGITVDYNLASTKEDMSYDVSKYFDVKTIKEIITKLK